MISRRGEEATTSQICCVTGSLGISEAKNRYLFLPPIIAASGALPLLSGRSGLFHQPCSMTWLVGSHVCPTACSGQSESQGGASNGSRKIGAGSDGCWTAVSSPEGGSTGPSGESSPRRARFLLEQGERGQGKLEEHLVKRTDFAKALSVHGVFLEGRVLQCRGGEALNGRMRVRCRVL